jgi:hypothetical protein
MKILEIIDSSNDKKQQTSFFFLMKRKMFYHIEIIKKIEISSEYIQVFVVYGALYR